MLEQIHHDQDAEVLLNTLLEQLPDVGLITWDGQDRITSLSQSSRHLMQLPDTAAVGASLDLLADSPCGEFFQRYRQFRASPGEQAMEMVIELARADTPYWLKLTLGRCPLGCGSRSAYLLIAREVTSQVRSNELARQAQGFIESALRAIPDGAVFADTGGRLTKISSGAERMFGLSEQDLLGEPVDRLLDNLQWPDPQPQGGSWPPPVFQMTEVVARDGRRLSAEVVTDWIRGENGAVQGSVAILRDVSERIALQDDLLKQTLLLDSIFRQLPFALSVIDTERRIVQMSDAALRLFGYAQEQTVNQLTRMLYPSQAEFDRVGRAIYQESPGGPVVADLLDAEGREFKGRIQVAPLYGSGTELRGYLVAIEDVTERMAYDEELRRYQQIVSASSDALIFIDRRHLYRAANEAYLKLWNLTREQVIGAHVSDIVGEDFYVKYTRKALQRCFAGESVFVDAVEVDYPSGRYYIDTRHTPYRDELGNITGVLITLRDVTQRHLAERAMQKNQQRFEQAGEFAEFAVWELDVETRQPVDDHMLRRLLGYADDDPLDSLEAWLSLVAEPDRQAMIESFERILSGLENLERLECRAIKKSGELVHVETLIEGKIEKGQRRLVGISRDISSLVQEREELRKYEHMTMAVQDGLALVDRQHVYRAVNSFYTRQYGYATDAIVNQPVAWLLGESLYRQVAKPVLDQSFGGESAHIERWIDYPRSGRRRVEITFSPYRDESGEITRVLVTTHDITDNYLAELALRDSEERFRAIFDNTPIGVVILAAEDGAILDANPAALRMHGYEREEFLRLRPWEVVIGITSENFAAEWGRVTKRRRSRFEAEHRRKDGGSLHVLADASRMQLNRRTVIIGTLVDISQQKQLELKLRQQQGQYRMLVESSNAILFAADPQTLRFGFVSQEAENLLGYPVSAWMQNPDFWIEHLHPEDRKWAPEFCLGQVKAGKDHDFDYRMIAADGRVVWLHDATSVIVQDGRVISLVGVMVDISASKEAEAERRRLSEMVRQSGDAILLTDTDFFITYINEAFTELYGYTLEDLRGRRPEILNAEPNAEEIHPQIYNALLEGGRVYRQLLNRRKDGSLFHCLHSITPLWNDQGDVIAYMSSQRDVTLQKQAEQALRESEEKYRRIVETAHEGIWVVDAEAVTTFVNPRMHEMLGYEPQEMLKRPFFEFMHERDRHAAGEFWGRLRQDGKAAFDFCYRRRDGADLWCHVSSSALNDARGLFTGAMSLLTDISEQRQLTEALIRSQKMEAVGQLTGGIAHDFNNILGSILGFAELAQGRFGDLDGKLKDYLVQIETAGGRARDLIRQLLIFSRGESTLSAEPIPLTPLVKEIVKMLMPMLPARVEIRCELPGESPSVKVDPLHVQQLLMNLCINARDAIEGSGLITVYMERRAVDSALCAICGKEVKGNWVVIGVSDTGRGIPEALRDDIFQPFITSKEVGEGSGMGLAVVRGIVNSYQGHLLLESGPGRGSRFEILLPEALPHGQDEAAQGSVADSMPQLTGLAILAIDDEPQYRAYYQELLGGAGAQVICCRSGLQALGRHQRDGVAYDLIISDQAMPGMNGTELIGHLRNLGCRSPVILCSGYGHEVGPEQMQQLQIVELLHKPVSGGDLLTAIRRVAGI